jgi:hypothetical protein
MASRRFISTEARFVRQREEGTVKNLAFVVALLILAIGAVGLLVPSVLVWIAQRSVTAGAYYVVAAFRVAFGLLLITVASVSRTPKTIRVLGYVILIAGIATALTALVAKVRADAFIEWWLQQGSGFIRLPSVLLLVLGGFIAYACAPARRAV